MASRVDAARAIEAERALRLELQRAWTEPSRRTPVRADEFDADSRPRRPWIGPPGC